MNRKKSLLYFSIMAAAFGYSQGASASDWGCQVLLCLSDPRGPTTEGECVPPIHKLWDHLRKGRVFPTCDLAGDSRSGSGSFARQTYDYYDPCPDGTTPASGQYVAQSSEPIKTGSRFGWGGSAAGVPYKWSSDANAGSSRDDGAVGARACVGKNMGSFWEGSGGDSTDQKIIQVYDKVVWQQPQSPRAIDVYIDGKIHKRVRY